MDSITLLSMGASMAAAVFLLTIPTRALALRIGFVAHPTSRGSHDRPTPLGGGIAFVVPVTMAWFTLAFVLSDSVLMATSILGLALAVMGHFADRRRVGPTSRLVVQAIASVSLAMLVLWKDRNWDPIGSPILVLAAAFALTWSTNVFNFMDGLDGLATTESLFVTLAGLAIASVTGADAGFMLALAALAGGLIGFLPWNAPRARIFMGDVGSTWLGFCLAALALQDAARMPSLLPVWLILPALFVVDASVCLIRRAIQRENVMAGHRAHAYQNLSRLLSSHGKVVWAFTAANLALLPAVWFSVEAPTWGWTMFGLVYGVAIAAAVVGRSGVHGVADPATRQSIGIR